MDSYHSACGYPLVMDPDAVEAAIATAAEAVLAERGVEAALITKGVIVFEYLDDSGGRYLGFGWSDMRAWEVMGMIDFIKCQVEVYSYENAPQMEPGEEGEEEEA